jgi:hypothetical protein
LVLEKADAVCDYQPLEDCSMMAAAELMILGVADFKAQCPLVMEWVGSDHITSVAFETNRLADDSRQRD